MNIEQIRNSVDRIWRFDIRKSYDQPKKIEVTQNENWLKLSSPQYSRFVELNADQLELNDLEILAALDYLVKLNAR